MEYNYVCIELELPNGKRMIPYNNKTKDIGLCNGILISNEIFIIHGEGHREGDKGLIKTLGATTPEIFQNSQIKFVVYDLNVILNQK